MTETLDRRELLRLLATVTLASTATPLVGQQETAEAEALPGLPGVDVQAIRDLGKAYVALGDDPEIATMVDRLRTQALTEEDLVEALRAEMREDFDADRIVGLYGWQLSRTEGRILAAANELLG